MRSPPACRPRKASLQGKPAAIGRLGRRKGGVLVKLRKPGQDIRVDMPTIGRNTVAGAASAGLAGIAVHGENTLVMDRQTTIADADAAGLFLVGLDPHAVERTWTGEHTR